MATRFWVGGTGNWDAATTTHWAATSGGAGGASVPTSADSVSFDANSGAAATVTVTAAANCSTLSLNKADLALSLSAGLTVAGVVTFTTGTFQTNGNTCSWGSMNSSGSATRVFDITGSAVTITGTNWTFQSTGLTFTSTGSTILFTDTTATAKTFNTGSQTYGDVTISGGGTGAWTITAASFATLTINAPKTIKVTSNNTLTIRTNLVLWGSTGNLITISAVTAGTACTITCSARTYIWCDWLSLTDIHASGTTAFYAGADSTNGGNNTGWTFAHWSMNATPASTSTASGALTAATQVSGSAASTSTATGALTAATFITGSPASTSTALGALSAATRLSGTVSSVSTAVGRLIYLPPPGRVILVRERPPVRLEIGVQTPTGGAFRWALDEHKPENTPSGLSFSTTMPGGFEQANLTLPRKPGIDYPDLAEFSDVTIRGVGGRVAWHGRIDATPRTSGTQRSVSPSMVGWQAHLDANENVQMIYVSQQASLWSDAPLAEQIRLASAATSYGDFSWLSQTGLVCVLPNQPVGAASAAEIWFIAPAGVLIAKIMYVGADFNMPAGWETPLLYSHSELLEAPSTAANAMTLDGALHTTTSTGPNRAISMRVFSNGTAATPVPGAQRNITKIGVYGSHGLTTRSTGATTPDGVLASDVVAHALQTWAPLLNFTTGPDGSIQPSAFVIPHLIFTSLPTKVSDIITGALRYELQDWAVWENKTFWMNDRGARGRHWQARVGPSGLQETGPQSSRIWNSVVAQFADVDGTQRTVGPPGSGCDVTDPTLVDPDPLNPANETGETRRVVIAMGTSTAAGATQVAARFLQEQKLVNTSGQASIVGHVQDSSGVWWPAHEMRGGDTCSFVDAHDPSPRRLVKTGYDDPTKANGISLDSPPDGMQELLDRMSISLIDTGLS